MDFFQPVVIKPPKWLIALSWLAALTGKGHLEDRRHGAGHDHQLGRVGQPGDPPEKRQGALPRASPTSWGRTRSAPDTIVEALKNAGVREVDEVREVRSLGLEMVRLPEP